MKSRIALLIAVFAVLAAACSDASGDTTTSSTNSLPPASSTTTSTTQPAPSTTQMPDDPAYTPRYVTSDCGFTEPFTVEPECGYMIVPEDRAEPDGAEVEIAVAIFRTDHPNPEPDPIVYLNGGPGGHTLNAIEFSFTSSYEPLLRNRDLILFDQRGVGLSEPALDCPEQRDVEIEYLDQDVDEEVYEAAYDEAFLACRDRLLDDGVDLSAYNSASNAADVADLRVALGYDEWNLWGISYGTRLALTVMRDHPEGIRSVVLDSSVPVELNLFEAVPSSASRAFGVFFDGCTSDPSCAAAYPDLEDQFISLADSLDENPAEILIEDFVEGESYPALLFGDDLYGLLFQSLYAENIIPLLPSFISDAANGDLSGLEQLSSVFFTNGPFISSGMYASVQCNEEYPFSSPELIQEAIDAYPEVADLFSDPASDFEDCSVWGAGTAQPIEDEPVMSDIPTLILGGEYDPITPPEYGRVAGQGLSNSTFFEFPGLAHGVSTADECATDILLGFIDDPSATPDGSCIDDLGPPDFFVLGEISVSLVPFDYDFVGTVVSGVRPDGWDDTDFGSFTAPGLGDTAIVQQAVPSFGFSDIDELADLYAENIGLEGEWSPGSYTDTTGRRWSVFSGANDTANYDLGVHDDGSNILIVILVTPDKTRDTYYDEVFTPVLDAIEAT